MSTRSKQKDDFEKMQLLARNNEEKAAEAVIASEQWLRYIIVETIESAFFDVVYA